MSEANVELVRSMNTSLGAGEVEGLIGLFHEDAVVRLRARVEAGRSHWSRLWALVVLSRWLRSPDRQPLAA